VYFLFDGQGSVVALANSSGSLVDQYSYDPYGNLIGTPTQGIDNAFQYIGVEKDSTGLYKTGERYYDPTLGHFTQVDPAACSQTTNLYWYGDDDPTNYADAAGTFPNPIGPIFGWTKCQACKAIVAGLDLGAKIGEMCEPAVFAACMTVSAAMHALGHPLATPEACHVAAAAACVHARGHELGDPYYVCKHLGWC
jgi:RHS repeat-associated protein